ncbi:hypothetical protein C0993_011576, partial [Termitomyces sp. T159_Od127]
MAVCGRSWENLSSTQDIPYVTSGGGIGGLALAAFICFYSKDIAVDVYETKNEISSIGAGIAIWKRTWQTLQDIGLEEEVKKRNISLPKDGEDGPLTVSRPMLLDMLKSRLSNLCTIYTSSHVANYEETPDGLVVINLRDGTTRTADILIGCDGVHSATRATFFRNLARIHPSKGYKRFCEPTWSGALAYRGLVDRSKLRERNPQNHALDNPRIHVVTHPFGDIVNLVCFYNKDNGFGTPFADEWVANVPKEEVIECYKDWEPDLVEAVSMIQTPSRWAIHIVESLPLFVSGPVGLLGDAAHAMVPHQGVGGGQAIEDAHILGRLLAHEKTNHSNLSKVLEIYQKVRLPQAQAAAQRSWSN